MSTSTGRRRRRALLLAGVGAVATLVGTASAAVAADGITVRLEPTEVWLAAVPIENFGGDPDWFFGGVMSGGSVSEVTSVGDFVPVPVQFGGTITVDVPAGLDASDATVELVFDANDDGIPEATYSSLFTPADPEQLDVTAAAGTVAVTLPADDPMVVDAATLSIGRLTSTMGPAFGEAYDTIDYEIEFDTATPLTAPAAQTVQPVLTATSQIPCGFSSYEPCPIPTPVTPGSTVTLALTQGSVLRELGLRDLAGVEVYLSALDDEGYDLGPSDPVAVEVTGSQATFVMPEEAVPGSYSLYVTQPTPAGGSSTVLAELTVEAAPAPAPVASPVASPVAEPAAPTLNPGLRSNTGVHLPEAEGGDGPLVAAGAGLLLMAGAGAAVARGRRRPAVESGPCEV
jgi:hypothetical protein